MKRDMDLIRDLLVAVENDPKYNGNTEFYCESPKDLGISGHSTEEVAYHLALLIEAGYIDGAVTQALPMHVIRKLTWTGHEFAAAIKSEIRCVQSFV